MKKLLFSFFTFLLGIFSLYSQGCSDLFISEYVEGGGNNKAIEIYNPTKNPISLSTYILCRYSNGSLTITASVSLSGATIPSYGTRVIVLDKRTPGLIGQDTMVDLKLQAKADTFLCPIYNDNSVMYFNGNDAVTLEKVDGTLVDIFGKIGENPAIGNGTGSEGGWTNRDTLNYCSGPKYWTAWTMNHTMIRKKAVKKGVVSNPASFNASVEWDTLPNNTFTNLKTHTCDCSQVSVQEISEKPHNAFFFPNPAVNQNFLVKATHIIANVEVTNISGQTIYKKQNPDQRGDMTVNLGNCASGMYFVKITFADKTVITEKIFVK